LNYSDWKHDETVDGEVENTFSNKQFDYRFVYDQAARGLFSGTAGVWGLRRNYEVVGEEAITPKVRQNSFAVFGVESVQMERLRLQFGGRLENTNYSAEDRNGRNFLGFSGSAGLNVPLWQGGALVASYNHSYRAPALEELFAFGPHPGNLTFEIGDAALRGERSNGLDISLRHARSRFKADANFFSYQLSRYVYLAPTGEIEDGLVEARYSQADARYTGVDGSLEAGVHRNLWVRAGFDAVNARLTMGSIPLPRIPPVRGRIGLDFRARGLSIAPEWTVANRQNRVFLTETPTAGYGVVSIRTSYTIARQHTMHIVSANVFNANNSFYRNHLSFIKELAPEIGRGVVFSYSLRFY
jgi:iron complex outermembrane receptor protein